MGNRLGSWYVGVVFSVGLLCSPPAQACEIASVVNGADPALIRPLAGRLIRDYGIQIHPLLDLELLHGGLDIAAERGAPVRAAQQGRIKEARFKGDLGNTVTVDHGGGWQTLYAHLQRFNDGIKPGSCVRGGDVIGFAGATGLAAETHLHFEVWHNGFSVNPADQLPPP